MVASVAVWLGIFDIILHSDDPYIVLAHQHLRHFIDIIHKGADDTHSRHIIQIFNHGLQRYLQSPALQFLHNAERLLYTGLDHLNGVALVFDRKLVI